MKNKVRIFSAEEKTKIVLELLKEDITLSQLSSKYEVNAKSIR
jgi:putative transposase